MMRTCAIAFAVATGLWAQESEKVLQFARVNTTVGFQEVLTAVRIVSEPTAITLDPRTATLTLRATANRLALGAWVFQELDRAPEEPPPLNSEMHEFRPEGMPNAVARVYFLPSSSTPPSIQDKVNAMRAVSDMQRLAPVYAVHAIAMRGTPLEVQTAVWGLSQMEQPRPGNSRDYHYPGESDQVVRMFFPAHLPDASAMQEIVNAVRSIGDVQRFFPVFSSGTAVMRGTSSQAEVCSWVMSRLDGAGPVTAAELEASGQIVKLLPAAAPTPADLQEMVNRIRTDAKAQRVFPLHFRNAIVLRGTAAQVAIAERIAGGESARQNEK